MIQLISVYLIALSSGQQCDIKGECFNATLNGISITDNAKECLKECKDVLDCKWFTYNPDGQVCEFLNDCDEINDKNCQNCLSGQATCPINQCNLSGLCMGNIIHSCTTDTKHECIKQCQTNQICHWFSYGSQTNTCLLFNTCPSLNEAEVDYISGQPECIEPNGPFTKVLISTGFSRTISGLTSTSEIIDLTNSKSTCEDFGNYTKAIAAATGGLLNNTYPVICGGTYNERECNTLGSLKLHTFLNQTKPFPSSIMVAPNTLWLTGSIDEYSMDFIGTSEYVKLTDDALVSFEGPKLPLDVLGHCMVALNESTFMMIGGGNDDVYDTNATFMIHQDSDIWIEGPSMEIPRRVFGCGALKVAEAGIHYAVVSGGTTILSGQSVEFLDLNDMDKGWFPGPYLPIPLHAHSMVATENSLVAIGGVTTDGTTTNDLFELTCSETGCKWKEMEQKLKIGRSNFVAMMVPDSLTNCEDL